MKGNGRRVAVSGGRLESERRTGEVSRLREKMNHDIGSNLFRICHASEVGLKVGQLLAYLNAKKKRGKAMSAYHPKEIEFLETIRTMKHDVGFGRMLQIILYEWNESHPLMTFRKVGDRNQKAFRAAKRGDPIAPIAGWDTPR